MIPYEETIINRLISVCDRKGRPVMRFVERILKKPDIKFVTENDLEERIISKMRNGTLESASIKLKSFVGIKSLKKQMRKVSKGVF